MASRQKNTFNLPYAGIDDYEGLSLLYGIGGEFSVIFQIRNPVLQYAADPDAYQAYHHILLNILKVVGEGHTLQKQDVFSRKKYILDLMGDQLTQHYADHFRDREYTYIRTYLVLTRQVKRGAFYTYDRKALAEFRQVVAKVEDLLTSSELDPVMLNERWIQHYVSQILGMSFSTDSLILDNLQSGDTEIRMGNRAMRSISLIDTDLIDLPEEIGTHSSKQEGRTKITLPVDNLHALHSVPGFDCMIYNQVIEIPLQRITLSKLEVKRKRHAGVPDPANNLCVEDIDKLLSDVARDNQLLVNAHFNILLCADQESIGRAANYLEAALFQQGIICSRNAYNQLELYRSVLPGNTIELKKYDWFLTTSDAAVCLFFKEALPVDERSDFIVRFTDRQGIPVAMDPADLPMRTNRINNRNKFVLGPSGSGKSFFMNALVEQYMHHQMDVVIIDTGHSYSGLCSYYGGRYITYSEKQPITMNPFLITESEYNIEKKDFLVTLISLLWKGADGQISSVERDVIANVISAYYSRYFSGQEFEGLSAEQVQGVELSVYQSFSSFLAFEDTAGNLSLAKLRQPIKDQERQLLDELTNELIAGELETWDLQALKKLSLKVGFHEEVKTALAQANAEAHAIYESQRIAELSFNSFYEFALQKIPEIKRDERIPFDLDEFRYVLKKFYRGGEFDTILNEAADASLFAEPFIVFEIDAIKESKILFAITTLVIMDVFIQKMRNRHDRRKALICEEAWKAIASPLMAGHLLYLYKTVRKFWGEAIVVTQELADILGNAVIKDSILSNSDTVCLLDQSKFKDDYQQIAKLLSLSEVEQRKIFTINQLDNKAGRDKFKEVYIRRGSTGEVYGVEVSEFQYLCYTTEKPEKNAVEQYVKHYGNYPDALNAFIKDRKRSGLELNAFVRQVNSEGIYFSEREHFKPDFNDETTIATVLPDERLH